MPARRTPSSYTAGKQITLEGVAYQPGDVVPNDVVRELRDLSALVSGRYLVPDVDPHGRRTALSTPSPIDYPVAVRKDIPEDSP